MASGTVSTRITTRRPDYQRVAYEVFDRWAEPAAGDRLECERIDSKTNISLKRKLYPVDFYTGLITSPIGISDDDVPVLFRDSADVRLGSPPVEELLLDPSRKSARPGIYLGYETAELRAIDSEF